MEDKPNGKDLSVRKQRVNADFVALAAGAMSMAYQHSLIAKSSTVYSRSAKLAMYTASFAVCYCITRVAINNINEI